MVDDADKRMENLFDLLGNSMLQQTILAIMYTISKGTYSYLSHLFDIQSRNFHSAKDQAMQLMANHQETASWCVGLKRLIELYEGL
jgi:hypothetical protein